MILTLPIVLSVIFNLVRDINSGVDEGNISKNSLIYVKNILIENSGKISRF